MAVGRQDVTVVEHHRSDVPAHAVHPVPVPAQELKTVDFKAATEVPGSAVVLAEQRVAAAAVAGQPAAPDVIAHDEHADEVAVGQALQVGVEASFVCPESGGIRSLQFADRTDGEVECRKWRSGELLWTTDVGTGVLGLACPPDEPAWVAVWRTDGVLYGVRDRAVKWKIDIDRGREAHPGEAAIRRNKAVLFVSLPASRRLLVVDPRAGRIRHSLPRPGLFSVTEKYLLTITPEGLRAYPLD
jgi:hypothetical protein